MHTLIRSILISSALGLTFACATTPPTTVAVNPISGNVYWTTGDTLWTCDGAGENCTKGKVTMVPTDSAITADSRLVFTAGSSVFSCNDDGQACIEVELPGKMKAVGLSVSPSGGIFVVGSDGSLAACSETSCSAVPNGAVAKPSESK